MTPLRGGAGTGRRALLGVAAMVLLTGMPSAAVGQEVRWSGSLQYAGGHYVFEDRTDAFYFTNGLTVQWDRFEFGVSLPLVLQNGGVVVLIGGVPIPTGGSQSGVVSRRQRGKRIGTTPVEEPTQTLDTTVAFDEDFAFHVADPTVSAGVQLYQGSGVLRSVRTDGRASVPLNDLDSGVGTGEWDFALGSSVALGVGKLLVFADASYWWFGDLPDLDLKDALSYGLALGVPFADGRASALVSLSGMTETISTMEAPLTLGASLGWSVGERTFLTVGGGAGLTESASDGYVQVGWSVR